MSYIKNVTDNQQEQIELAANDSAIRVESFDGKLDQVGQTKFVRAYDLNAQGNAASTVTSAVRQFNGSGLCVGSHNDKPARFETPGKA